MLRRFFIFFFLLSFLVCFFVFPVFAASYNFILSYNEDEGYLAQVDSFPTSGTVHYNITASFVNSPGSVLTASGSSVLIKVEVDPGVYAYFLSFSFDEQPMPLVLMMASLNDVSMASVNTPDGTLGPGMIFNISLSTVEYPAFEVSTSTGLSSAISWVKTVTDSLISGDLVDLLSIGAIAISISLLLLTAKIIRKFSWGA